MTHISLQEAASLCSRSQTWTRERIKRLSKEGRARKNERGKWEVEREAILAIAGLEESQRSHEASSGATQESHELEKMLEFMRNTLETRERRISALEEENRVLRAELLAITTGNTKGKLSRFLGEIKAAKREVVSLFSN